MKKKKRKKVKDLQTCQHARLNAAPHTCPFKSDINGDNETLCRCCSDCEHNCLMDI